MALEGVGTILRFRNNEIRKYFVNQSFTTRMTYTSCIHTSLLVLRIHHTDGHPLRESEASLLG
eukprot:5144056-Heterocapsa_arctica.AAC.1